MRFVYNIAICRTGALAGNFLHTRIPGEGAGPTSKHQNRVNSIAGKVITLSSYTTLYIFYIYLIL
jgi:hypothetical protein